MTGSKPGRKRKRLPLLISHSDCLGKARKRTFALPLVIAAQEGLVLLYLDFQLAEGLLAGRAYVLAAARGVQGPRWQRQVQ